MENEILFTPQDLVQASRGTAEKGNDRVIGLTRRAPIEIVNLVNKSKEAN